MGRPYQLINIIAELDRGDMEKHTIRLTAIIGLGWLCFLASYVDQESTAKTSSLATTLSQNETAETIRNTIP
jgi:hypothetical protein